jgi:SNF2 family DNA or RNA helicase
MKAEPMIIEYAFKKPPFEHQRVGIKALVEHEAFALFDEMGAGKSKQVIDAACILAEQGKIDTVVIVAPASVRCVWLDKEIGEIKKHSWMRNRVYEFRKDFKEIWEDPYQTPQPNIDWVVTNYEWLRSSAHLETLTEKIANLKTLLILDESSYVKNRTSAQAKSVLKLRKHCARCVLLNGTPVTNSPLDLWSQMQILDEKILSEYFKNFHNFRYSYCTMRTQKFAGRSFQQVVEYKNLGELAQRISPFVLRREKKDCLDLPAKLYTEREVALSAESWKRYQELKHDALISLGEAGEKRMEPNAAVRLMRLAQLTSGILGGNRTVVRSFMPTTENDDWDGVIEETKDISDEKLRWAVEYLTEECTAKAVIVWCRWRRERERLFKALDYNPEVIRFQLYGGQEKKAREVAVTEFSAPENRSVYYKRKVLIAQPHAGGHGLNLVAASESIYLSNDFALGMRLQSEDRCHRLGQVNPVTYIDVLATGPKGQHTIDHVIFKALREKKNVADLTCAEWRKELNDGQS